MTKVYLAEDDETMVTLLVTLLTIEGFEAKVIDLAKGNLLDILRAEPPNILILDVNLPGESGLDIVRKMREEDTFKNTRVVMASGMSLKDECLASGADDFLMKPYMPDDLIQILRRYT